MIVIFLDIDGVLITGKRGWKTPGPENVAALNRLIEETGAEIVVSSCWRVGRSVPELAMLLGSWGVKGHVLDRTFADEKTRGQEILTWIHTHPENWPMSIPLPTPVEEYVILDDDADMGLLLNHLVQTDPHSGLTQADVDRAIHILKPRQKQSTPDQQETR